MNTNLIQLKAWDLKLKRMWGADDLSRLPMDDLRRADLIFLQFIYLGDKKRNKIFVGDVVKIKVEREQDNRQINVNHGAFYLNAEVLDVRGNLKYNEEAVKALEAPMGREKLKQFVSYDSNLFHAYSSMTFDRDEKGEPIRDQKDPCKNVLRYSDVEVVGDKYNHSVLLR